MCQKLTSKILGSTSLFYEDCITRQKYKISLDTIQITQILSVSITSMQESDSQYILSIQICHEVTLLISNTHAQKCSGLKGQFPKAGSLKFIFSSSVRIP